MLPETRYGSTIKLMDKTNGIIPSLNRAKHMTLSLASIQMRVISWSWMELVLIRSCMMARWRQPVPGLKVW